MDTIARTPQQLGQALRSRRAKLKLSQTDVGLKVGIKQDTVSMLEIHTPSSTVETLFKALSALGLELVVREKARTTPTAQEW
ncbi:MAG: helix-turn-helix domain-containing protein [Steroidobacteraceae bacterium]